MSEAMAWGAQYVLDDAGGTPCVPNATGRTRGAQKVRRRMSSPLPALPPSSTSSTPPLTEVAGGALPDGPLTFFEGGGGTATGRTALTVSFQRRLWASLGVTEITASFSTRRSMSAWRSEGGTCSTALSYAFVTASR
jgi:hypothetical protein